MRVYEALVVLTLARTAAGQSLDKVPAFEVADVKPSKGESPNGGKIRILPGGRLEMPNTTVKRLIMGAYGVQEYMVIGGPNWIDSDEFDIIANAPPDTPRETIRAMLQPLLAERFKCGSPGGQAQANLCLGGGKGWFQIEPFHWWPNPVHMD